MTKLEGRRAALLRMCAFTFPQRWSGQRSQQRSWAAMDTPELMQGRSGREVAMARNMEVRWRELPQRTMQRLLGQEGGPGISSGVEEWDTAGAEPTTEASRTHTPLRVGGRAPAKDPAGWSVRGRIPRCFPTPQEARMGVRQVRRQWESPWVVFAG